MSFSPQLDREIGLLPGKITHLPNQGPRRAGRPLAHSGMLHCLLLASFGDQAPAVELPEFIEMVRDRHHKGLIAPLRPEAEKNPETLSPDDKGEVYPWLGERSKALFCTHERRMRYGGLATFPSLFISSRGCSCSHTSHKRWATRSKRTLSNLIFWRKQ